MKRIALTQRIEINSDYGERRDCLDQRWTHLLQAVSMVPVPLPNCVENVPEYLDDCEVDGVIFTGGNDVLSGEVGNAPERDQFEGEVLNYFESRAKPMLGVCRGMQFIALNYGGSIKKITGHTAIRHKVTFSAWWEKTFTTLGAVNSYHNWGVSLEGSESDLLTPEAWASDGNIEAIRHRRLPIFGVMWHPEREEPPSSSDKSLIEYIFR